MVPRVCDSDSDDAPPQTRTRRLVDSDSGDWARRYGQAWGAREEGGRCHSALPLQDTALSRCSSPSRLGELPRPSDPTRLGAESRRSTNLNEGGGARMQGADSRATRCGRAGEQAMEGDGAKARRACLGRARCLSPRTGVLCLGILHSIMHACYHAP